MIRFLLLLALSAVAAMTFPTMATRDFPGQVCRSDRTGGVFTLPSGQLQRTLGEASFLHGTLYTAPVWRHADCQMTFDYNLRQGEPSLENLPSLVLREVKCEAASIILLLSMIC